MLTWLAINPTGRRLFLTSIVGGLFLKGMQPLAAQQGSDEAYVPKQSDRPEAIEGDEAGFIPIFDGQTLDGWEGDSTYWRVENDSLVGEITPQTVVRSNTFIIWQGCRPKDFETQARLSHHAGRQQRHQLPQRHHPRSGDAGEPVRNARLSVRSRREEAVFRQQL